MISTIIQKILHGYAVLEKVDSKFNGPLEIREDISGKRTLVAGGLAQSGKEVEKIWKEALNQILNTKYKIQNCLILGLGAGTAAQLVNQKFPLAKITGIEIDPEIIRLGKKYFNLEKTASLHIIVTDAIDWIINLDVTLHREFDLILIDIYKGSQFPKQAESLKFLEKLKQLSADNGIIIFNRLYYYEKDKKSTDIFGDILRRQFNAVKKSKIGWNKFFFVK